MDGQTGNVENQLQKSPAFVSSVRQFAGKCNLKRKLLKVDMKLFFKICQSLLTFGKNRQNDDSRQSPGLAKVRSLGRVPGSVSA